MAEKSCWTCLRFSECDRMGSKSRKYKLWNAPHKFSDFYHQTADNCNGWTEDNVVSAQILANKLLNKIGKALKAGKIVALNQEEDTFTLQGEYDSEDYARISTSGDNNILLLKALPNHDLHF